jgi:ribosome assembly protein 1
MEAYERLKRVIAEARLRKRCEGEHATRLVCFWRVLTCLQRFAALQVNRVMSSFASEKFLSDADAFMAAAADGDGGGGELPVEEDVGDAPQLEAEIEEEEEGFSFSPEKGNVAFASAVDGCAPACKPIQVPFGCTHVFAAVFFLARRWAFRTEAFAHIYAARLGCSAPALRRALWGDFFYVPKTKRIVGRKAAEAALGARARPLFVQLALEPLWQLYAAADAETAAADGTPGAVAPPPGKTLADMARALGVADALPRRDLAAADRRVALRGVLRAWLPLSEAILEMAVQRLPGALWDDAFCCCTMMRVCSIG